jgi:outer membrane protein assembly factor BamB
MDLMDLVFVAFGKHVIALDRATGTIHWKWEAPKGKAYPALHLDRDRLFVSMLGYTYCLDPWTGTLIWQNELTGLRADVAAIATVSGSTDLRRPAAAAIAARRAASAGGGASNVHFHPHAHS